jgi:hypothetical protein
LGRGKRPGFMEDVAMALMNDEIRMTNDESNSNEEMSNERNAARGLLSRFGHLNIRHSDLIRHSSFVIRHSVRRLPVGGSHVSL